jgi:hypothetical protein
MSIYWLLLAIKSIARSFTGAASITLPDPGRNTVKQFFCLLKRTYKSVQLIALEGVARHPCSHVIANFRIRHTVR